MTIRQLGYPTKNALKAWYREYKSSQELRTGYKRPAKFSQVQREQAVEHYHLGSTIGIVDEGGQLLQRMSYDAWGRRRNIDGSDDSWGSLGTIKNDQDNSGYTGHEQMDQLGLVHMNARLYDPITGWHVSADPTIPDPKDQQAFNRFSYVLNNALAYTDPTGLAPEGSFVVFQTLSNQFMTFDQTGSGSWGCVLWKCRPDKPKKPVPDEDDEDDGAIKRRAAKTPSDEASRNKLIAGFWLDGEKIQNRYAKCSGVECQEVEVAAIELDGRMRGAGLTLNERWASGIPQIIGAFAAPRGEWGVVIQAAAAGGILNLQERAGTVRSAMAIPKVADAKLGNIVRDLYKGAKMPAPIGTGSTADAIRSELATGLPTGGRFHSQKGAEYIKALDNWLARNPNALHYDRMVAESLKNDIAHALGK